MTTIGLGTLDANGDLAFTAHVPNSVLPPGIGGITLIEQLVLGSPSAGIALSSTSVLVLVDALP